LPAKVKVVLTLVPAALPPRESKKKPVFALAVTV